MHAKIHLVKVFFVLFAEQLFGDLCFECNRAITGDGKSNSNEGAQPLPLVHYLTNCTCSAHRLAIPWKLVTDFEAVLTVHVALVWSQYEAR